MFTKPSAPDRESNCARWRSVGLLGLAVVLAVAATACEDKGLGRSCDVTVDAGTTQGAYNMNAAECPSRLCVKPAIQPGVSTGLDTGAYCTIRCSSDSDCSDGQQRDPSNAADFRCRKGYACAKVFDRGGSPPRGLCCDKVCLCRDFFSASVGPAIPQGCQEPDAGLTCS